MSWKPDLSYLSHLNLVIRTCLFAHLRQKVMGILSNVLYYLTWKEVLVVDVRYCISVAFSHFFNGGRRFKSCLGST